MNYRIKHGKHRTKVDGRLVVLKPGDVFEPTAKELKAFRDKFEAVDSDEDEAVEEGNDGEGGEATFKIVSVGRGRNKKFNVVDPDGDAVNEEPLSEDDAEALLALKLEEAEED